MATLYTTASQLSLLQKYKVHNIDSHFLCHRLESNGIKTHHFSDGKLSNKVTLNGFSCVAMTGDTVGSYLAI